MKTTIFISIITVTLFTNCSNEAIALNEYNPTNTTKISSVSAEVTQKDILEAKQRRAQYLKTTQR